MKAIRHTWDMTPKEAIELQKKLRQNVALLPLEGEIKTIAGADVSLERFGTELFAGIIVFSYPDLVVLESAVVKMPVGFPYVPGLLSFREIPGLLECLQKLKIQPDVIVVDGQGIAHPRRLGIATHLGLVTGIPTIGCAKSKLFGVFNVPKKVGETSRIVDPHTGERIGYALKSKNNSNPLIISPGHNITIEESFQVVQKCLRGYRLPEPTRQAHILVNEFRRKEKRS